MTKSKSKFLQLRIEPELHKRFEKYAEAEGLPISAAVRRCMTHAAHQYEVYLAKQEAEKQRILNKR